jgi:GT2 family glycosyltransferase
MGTPTVSIIIPTYNGRAHLEECFRSLHALNYPQDRREVIVVDNGSTDGSVEYLKAFYPDVMIIQNERNMGFAGPCNQAARCSQSEYLAFLNNDTRVDSEWLNELTRSVGAPRIGAERVVCAAGRIVSWDGRILEYGGGVMNFHGHGHHLGMGQSASAGSSHEQLTFFACAASMLIRRDIFFEVGGFDPDYFAYFEDVDLGWRLWLFGFQVLYCPTAVVFHKGHGTTALSQAERKKLLERNGLFNIFKNYSDALLERTLLPALSLTTMKASLDREYSASYLEGINDFFASLDQLRLKRRDVQRRRTVEDSELFLLFRQPFRPSFYDVNYWTLQRRLVRSFGLDRRFYKQGGLMKEQLIAYENLIEDQYRLQRETASLHETQLAEARQEADTLRSRIGELEALAQTPDGQLAEARQEAQARDGQLTEARQEAQALRTRAGELEALAQAQDGQLAEARQEAETLRSRIGELEALAQAQDGQLAEARQEAQARDGQLAVACGRVSVLEEQSRLQERLIEATIRRLDEFLEQQSRRLSSRIVNFLFWSRGPRP